MYDRRQILGAGCDALEAWWRSRGQLADDFGDAVAAVGRHTSEKVVQHGADGIDVGALIDLLPARLLGRHVFGRTDYGADDRHWRRRHAIWTDIRRRLAGGLSFRNVRGQAPVDDHGFAEWANQDIRGLQVAMNDSLAMRISDGIRHGDDVRKKRQSLFERMRFLENL